MVLVYHGPGGFARTNVQITLHGKSYRKALSTEKDFQQHFFRAKTIFEKLCKVGLAMVL
jgi:hypothetical protein